jgi:hypothetical protein
VIVGVNKCAQRPCAATTPYSDRYYICARRYQPTEDEHIETLKIDNTKVRAAQLERLDRIRTTRDQAILRPRPAPPFPAHHAAACRRPEAKPAGLAGPVVALDRRRRLHESSAMRPAVVSE